MECVNKAGQLMSLAALQQHDPYIVKLLDVTGQVALYTFNPKANEWEKNEIEGTLFVYARSASPHHGFTIMNRLSTENLVEPINKDLEFQLQDPFLLYRNGNLGIYSIWFYDKADCQRIAQLMLQIVKQESLRVQCVSPDRSVSIRTNGCVQNRPAGILELLSKAKEEYQRSRSTERDVSVNCESQEKREDVTAAQHEKSSHSVVKQITVEELFGSSLPKDPPPLSSISVVGEGLGLRGIPFNPALAPRLSSDPGGPPLLSLLQPRDPRTAAEETSAPRGSTSPFPPAFISADAHGMPVSLPGFMPSPLVTPQSFRDSGCKTSAPFSGKTAASAPGKEVNAFTQPPALVKPVPAGPVVQGEESSLLLSPSVFQHSVNKATEAGKSSASPTSPTDPPTALYSRTQLQDTLIHLIKNDAQFLNTIHEAYVQSLSKGLNNVKL
ncbi:mRNA-decapping enzyme 1A [Danio rerio]|uniref:5'-(N(7)-methylguanosine 5'-triphospho)-[mRNA] hydrolase n=1 Tax=Danio rerio TaxID=7955 RepID=Q803I0_DANRE|nr:mRNA-decapping enzyme 1A [Danio rerio]AAH44477.1 Decapping enzyme [Danio rerio]AAI65194.1 Decapping enzyme [Danio rerio]|eukprot:NP_878313.2 mRNA-decapping enzyme 1A [Danio rerio]